MKKYLAVVKQTDGVIEKYLDFDTQAEADSHVAQYGGFACATPNAGGVKYWVADASTKTVTHDSSTQTSEETRKGIIKEIVRLESQETPRRLAEALPDEAGGSLAGRQWLKANRDAIATERAKL